MTDDDATPRATGRDADDQQRARRRFVTMTVLDVAVPLAVFYGLRLAGVNQWWALILGGIVPLVRVGYTIVRGRRLEWAGIFTVTLLVIGTGIGLLTGDPRLLLARESYLTGVIGAWILITLLTARPFLFSATLPLLPAQTAGEWQQHWDTGRVFRRAMRLMTAAWGIAFLLDAAARVVMAYTLPLDWVPVLSISMLVLMLIIIVQGTKTWGRRQQFGDRPDRSGPQRSES